MDILSGLYDPQALELSEKAHLLSDLLPRGDEHDLRRALSFVSALNPQTPRWNLVGVLLIGLGRESYARAILDDIGALAWARQPRSCRELALTNAVVSEIAVAIDLEDPSLPRARVAFALALSPREFLGAAGASDDRDQLLALEMLIRHHLAPVQAIATAERAFRSEAPRLVADSDASSRFVSALAALTTRVMQEEPPLYADALRILLNDCSAAMLRPEHAQSSIRRIEMLDGSVER